MTANGTPSGQFRFSSSSNATSVSVSVGVETARPRASGTAASKAVENAVYSHIRAIRGLGRETINTDEIARALGIPTDAVNAAVSALLKKGVKLA